MTPQQKLKHLILLWEKEYGSYFEAGLPKITAENVDAVLDQAEEEERLYDARNEIRSSGQATGLKEEYSRHYESKSVATEYMDGSWVGWTYWYGGGKHGEPEAVEWLEYAYDLTCEAKEMTIIHRTFTKVEDAS